ncbi:MAG: aspartate ammonia-lyase [Proteobacteria bacterium]|nr:aspartate ammonia-lyase [Pseudomonadota bacterium]
MKTQDKPHRIEKDLLGEVSIPMDAAYGAQTQRALENFPLAGEKSFADYPELLKAFMVIKKACVKANAKAGQVDNEQANAITQAISKIEAGDFDDQFPVHSFHGGGGVSFNMNVNEVIANLANHLACNNAYGSYEPVHPNNHVNLNQSTSDVFCTAIHIAVIEKWQSLGPELQKLAQAFFELGERWQTVKKIARTCLQDAVEISFHDYFSGYRDLLVREHRRLDNAVSELYSINLGGTIVGRPEDANEDYREQIVYSFVQTIDNSQYSQRSNLFDSAQNLDDVVHVSSHLNQLARSLVKVCQDLRLISSGPQTGFGEIRLPAVQPGSSAMPGKINPTVPEFLMQCCFQVSGKHAATDMVLDHGELDLNIWGAVVVVNILDSMSCLENGTRVFRTACVEGIDVIEAKNRENIQTIIPLINRLKLEKGYSFATKVFKDCQGDPSKIRQYLD